MFLQRFMRVLKIFVSNANCAKSFSALSSSMPEDSTNCERAEVIRDGDCRNLVSDIAYEEVAMGDTRLSFGLSPNWMLEEYCCECAGMMDTKRLDAVVVDGRDPVIYDRNRLERDTAIGAWKRRWAVLG